MRNWMSLAAALVTLATGFNTSGADTDPPLRFLFLVDTSRSMARLKKVTPGIVHDVIASGFQGRIERGERFGIWTFSDHVMTNQFPAQDWTHENSQVAAEDAVRFLSKQRFANATRMEKALAEVRGAIAASPRITILLLTDGDDRFAGTPFDRSINGILMEFAKTLRRQKKPFVIVLQGENGVLTAWRAHTGGGQISYPDMPDPLREAPSVLMERFVTNIVVAPKTNSMVRHVETPTISENPKPPPVEPAKPIAVVPPVAVPSVSPVEIAVPEKKVEPAPVAPGPVAVSKPEATPIEPARTPPPEIPVKTPPVVSVKAPPEAPSIEVPAKKTIVPPVPTVPAVQTNAPRPIGPLAFAVGGGGLLVICGIAFLVLKRSKRPSGPSLISRSLEGDGKE